MKQLIYILLVGLMPQLLNAQSQADQLIDQVKQYNQDVLSYDYEQLINWVDPDVIEKGGGKELTIDMTKQQMEATKSLGMYPVEIKPKQPGKFYTSNDRWYTLLPQEVIMKFGPDLFKKTTYYLATSLDKGQNWYFLDLDQHNDESIGIFLPDMPKEIEIPPVEQAQLVIK